MICLQEVKKYCKEYWKIENYQEAVNDQTQTWACHHRHEIDWALPMEELIDIGRYYDVHYSELIFLTLEEHKRLHMEGENNPNYGEHLTGEHKQKISDSLKGKSRSEETKAKISTAMKGKHHTEEAKRKISDANTKTYIFPDELYNLYVLQGLSQSTIAKLYGCTQTTIWHKLKKHNIKK